MDANVVAFDPEAVFTVTPERLHYRHAISPYMGEHLRGVVRRTWLRGEEVYRLDADAPVFAVNPRGREYALSCSLSR